MTRTIISSLILLLLAAPAWAQDDAAAKLDKAWRVCQEHKGPRGSWQAGFESCSDITARYHPNLGPPPAPPPPDKLEQDRALINSVNPK